MRDRLAILFCSVAAGLSGCGADEGITGGGAIVGDTLTVVSLLPFDDARTADLVAGQKLALYEAGGRVGDRGVNFASIDDGRPRAAGGPDEPGDAARTAIRDTQVIAVIGRPREETVPLTNAAGLLQVVPGAEAAAGLPDDPRLFPSGRRTLFAGGAGGPIDSAEFRRFFAREPGPAAAEGYAAMRGVLEALEAAGDDANRRQAVIDAFSAGA